MAEVMLDVVDPRAERLPREEPLEGLPNTRPFRSVAYAVKYQSGIGPPGERIRNLAQKIRPGILVYCDMI